MKELINETIAFVKARLAQAEAGHDWFHTERVWKLAIHLAEKEQKGDRLVVELGALLHDISDPKFNGGDENAGGVMARRFLEQQGLDEDRTRRVVYIIDQISFKGGISKEEETSDELMIVRDADRLDALGAIGIARTFHYGGFRNRPIYDPRIDPVEYASSAAYRASEAPTINHFYEKLLKLKDLMHTGTGRKLAEARHRYMEEFLAEFYGEWEGER